MRVFRIAAIAVVLMVGAGATGALPGCTGSLQATSSGATSSVVGAQGGSVTLSGGTGVTVPAGALPSNVTVTVTPSPSAPTPAGTVVGTPYTFGPEGQKFSSPVTVTLAFDPEAPIPRVLMLAEGALEVDAVVTVDEPDASVARLPLELDLDSGVANHGGASPPRKLADAITDARGRARFFVPEASLGTPGTSLLRIAFAGDRTHVKASHEMACETRVRVVVNAHKNPSLAKRRLFTQICFGIMHF